MDDIEQLFEFASESVRRGNKRRDDEKKQLPENIIANAMLRKSAEMIQGGDDDSIKTSTKVIDCYRKLKR